MINKEISPGDYVEVVFGKNIYKGIFLESPDNEKGLVLIKLDSGYNVGFIKKDVLKINLIKKKTKETEKINVIHESEKPNIAMILTGGTIASRYDLKTGGVHPLDSPENLFKFYPDLFKKVNVTKVEVPFMKWSENMDFHDWKKIANAVEPLLKDSNIRGIIITHGTDFLHYTASAMSFFIKNLNKPIVLTYSQRSIDRASSDANLNLQCAALAAVSDMAEIMLVGHAGINDDFCYAMPGTKVRKLHTSRRDAFKVVNSKPLAKIFPDKIELISEHNLRNEKNKPEIDAKFEEKIALVKFYPGQDPEILDYYLKKGFKGIVIEAAALGQVATGNSRKPWTKKLKEIIDKGITICITSQCIYGRVDPFVYSAGREISKTGVIYLSDMLAETAFVKLGWVLGHKEWASSSEKVREMMLKNFSHELNSRIED